MGKLKILAFYRYNRYYSHDEDLHGGFLKAIGETSDVDLKVYGPYVEDILPQFLLKRWSTKLSMQDLYNEFKPDVIICMTKARMFYQYNPKEAFIGNEWLPSEFNAVSTPKIILEEDYFYEKNDKWHQDRGIDLILQRHYMQSLKQEKVKQIWFPFSVDIDKFKSNSDKERKNRISFVGHMGGYYYDDRKSYCKTLKDLDLIDIYANDEKLDRNYVECLQSYRANLVGCSSFDITPAKIFEAMASGSLVLINEDQKNGLNKIFKNKCYLTFKDSDELVQQANFIMRESEIVKSITENAMLEVRERHSHKVRIGELLNIINTEFNIKQL